MDLIGKTAVVTGGAHRVGAAIALALAERGCNIVLHFNASEELAHQTSTRIKHFGVRCPTIQADLSRHTEVLKLFAEIDRTGFDLDLLVNSAAIMHSVDLLSAGEADWERTINLNLKAAFFCLQQAAMRMQVRGGLIVNISDIAGHRPWSRYPIHSISKAGLEMLTQVAALRLAPKIRVNAIAPGPVLKPETMPASRWREITDALPLRRGGDGLDVARAVIFLAENEFITGETLVVDGGNRLV